MNKSLKKVITLGLVCCVATGSCGAYHYDKLTNAKEDLNNVSSSIEEQVSVKDSAHQIANHARKIGDSTIETMAQERWVEANNLHIVLVSKRKELEATIQNIESKYRFLDTFKITHYADVPQSQGRWVGQTATGAKPTVGKTIAVDPKVIPLGSTVHIEGYGTYTAQDTGGAIKGNKIDVLVSDYPTAMSMGVKYAKVYVIDD